MLSCFSFCYCDHQDYHQLYHVLDTTKMCLFFIHQQRSMNYQKFNAGIVFPKWPGYRNCMSLICLDLYVLIGQHLLWTFWDQVSVYWTVCSTAIYQCQANFAEGLQTAQDNFFCNHPAVLSYIINTVAFCMPRRQMMEGKHRSTHF